jgi:hypothetical protein
VQPRNRMWWPIHDQAAPGALAEAGVQAREAGVREAASRPERPRASQAVSTERVPAAVA